ncbi:MAG TPA: hypothetical protein VG013_39905 [Gemmataceae bacterium]|jgi:antitoxin (DNA-binding transcriptional repressor) of toxin-antitoxin stability system|nr:hypothetical protein [Gemmataceae bacterium]
MSSFIALADVQAQLSEILDRMHPGEQLFVTGSDGHILATFIKEAPPRTTPRQPGSAVGKLVILAEDDEHLQDFDDYLE